jgi:hypothetical protein
MEALALAAAALTVPAELGTRSALKRLHAPTIGEPRQGHSAEWPTRVMVMVRWSSYVGIRRDRIDATWAAG